jgi:hypothetical protein
LNREYQNTEPLRNRTDRPNATLPQLLSGLEILRWPLIEALNVS